MSWRTFLKVLARYVLSSNSPHKRGGQLDAGDVLSQASPLKFPWRNKRASHAEWGGPPINSMVPLHRPLMGHRNTEGIKKCDRMSALCGLVDLAALVSQAQ